MGHQCVARYANITAANSTSLSHSGPSNPGQGETVSGTVNNFGWFSCVVSEGLPTFRQRVGGDRRSGVGSPSLWVERPNRSRYFGEHLQWREERGGLFTFDSRPTRMASTPFPGWSRPTRAGGRDWHRYFTIQKRQRCSHDRSLDPYVIGHRRPAIGSVVGRNVATAPRSTIGRGAHLTGHQRSKPTLRRRLIGSSGHIDPPGERVSIKVDGAPMRYHVVDGRLALPVGAAFSKKRSTLDWQPGAASLASTTSCWLRDGRLVPGPRVRGISIHLARRAGAFGLLFSAVPMDEN